MYWCMTVYEWKYFKVYVNTFITTYLLPKRQRGPTLYSQSVWCLYSCQSGSDWQDSSHRNYPIHLKFGTNVYTLCKISWIVFDIYCLNSACAEIHKSISIRPMEGNFLKSVLTWVLCIKFNEFYICYSDGPRLVPGPARGLSRENSLKNAELVWEYSLKKRYIQMWTDLV